MQTYIGTSGWSYPSGFGNWKGIFYPKRWSGDELAYYAERFPAVEVNSSFYHIPAADVARGWANRTPPGFKFTCKLYRKFTHPGFFAREEGQSPEITPEDVAGVRLGLDALAEAGKLGALLVQYPDFFYFNEDNLASLVRTMDHFHAYPLAVELRNKSWQRERTREVLAHFRAAFVRIDEPFFRNLDEQFDPAANLQYWRFHGRNEAQWKQKGAGNARYDYLYSEDELDDLAESLRSYTSPEGTRYVFFNNHPGGKAPTNALELAERLSLPINTDKFGPLAQAFPRIEGIVGSSGRLALFKNIKSKG